MTAGNVSEEDKIVADSMAKYNSAATGDHQGRINKKFKDRISPF
jgi:hypothetical protein